MSLIFYLKGLVFFYFALYVDDDVVCRRMMMLFICRQSSCSSADNHIVLSVDNISVLVAVLVDERLVVLGHTTQRHTHVRESTVVEKSLHSNLLGKVGEHHNAIVGTFVGTCIASGDIRSLKS